MKRSYNSYILLYTFTYAAVGILVPFIGQYLNSIGFSGGQIGTVTAVGTVVAIFAQAVWGKVYSSSKRQAIVLLCLCILAALTAGGLVHVRGYLLFVAVFGVLYFFQAPVMSLSDAMAVGAGQPFGAVRKWGAIGFAAAAFAAGEVTERFGLETIFYMYIAAYVLSAAVIWRIYNVEKRTAVNAAKDSDPSGVNYRALMKNSKLLKLLLCMFFFCGTNVANNTYFSFLYIEGGGSLAGVGIAFLLMAGSEMPFMAWSAKLSAKFTLEKTVLAAMIISVIRFAWYGTEPGSVFLIITFFLQGAVNGIILVEFVRYVAKAVSTPQLGLAISAYYAFSSNLSTIICQFVGGHLLDHFGAGGVYMFFSFFNLTGLVLYIIFKLHHEG